VNFLQIISKQPKSGLTKSPYVPVVNDFMDLWKICHKMMIATNYHHYFQLLADCRVQEGENV